VSCWTKVVVEAVRSSWRSVRSWRPDSLRDRDLNVPQLYLVYTIKQRWSKHQANLEHTSCTCILNTLASSLLHLVNGVLQRS